MGAVDIRFDQAETWLIRNTFKVPIELIPYILLPHHPLEGFPQASTSGGARGNDNDEALMKQLEGEISKVNGLREEIAILDTVDERINRRVLALKKMKSSLSELLSAGGTRGALCFLFKNRYTTWTLAEYMSLKHRRHALCAFESTGQRDPKPYFPTTRFNTLTHLSSFHPLFIIYRPPFIIVVVRTTTASLEEIARSLSRMDHTACSG
jgi:hypothetical protein